jgi:acyl-CoA thioester hydrolase
MIEPVKIQVRFSDIDVMGHVNNAVYLNYFETARMHYFHQLLGIDWDWTTDGIILLRNEIDYVKSVLLTHSPMIKIAVEKIGGKSFALSYELTVDDVVYTRGKSTMVCFNYKQQSTVEIPEILRSKLEELIVE